MRIMGSGGTISGGVSKTSSFTVGFVGLAGLVSLISIGLLSNNVLADDDIDKVNIVVPSSCSFSDEVIPGDTEHSATMHNGEYKPDIGTTTFKAYCNDNNGYSVYAIGYSNDTYGNTNMIHDTDSTYNFDTSTAPSGDVSTWSMKLTPVAGTYAPTIQSDANGVYTNYHVVPSTYTKVATFPNRTDVSATGTGIGSAFQTTYAVWISNSQVAGTYTGKVRYTLVHPNNEAAPLQPQPCSPGTICYYSNASDSQGTMGTQDLHVIDWSSCANTNNETYCFDSSYNEIDINTLPRLDTFVESAILYASNFSRDGYGFAGWTDAYDYATNPNAKFYGPQETITVPEGTTANGLSLYAVWVKSTGSLQDADKVATLCGTGTGSLTQAPTNGTANLSSVSALTDQRDNQTYAIAKLADGKCWMIENLRLEAEDSRGNNRFDPSVTNASLSQGYNPSFTGLAGPESAKFSDSTTANSLYTTGTGVAGKNTISGSNQGYRFPRYNNNNTSQRAANTTNTNANTYSYGNYYTWHAVIADTTRYTSGNHNTTSICPTGWHIPTGNTSGEYYVLNTNANSGATNTSTGLRSYPTNFLYSGHFSTSSASNRGSRGLYWSSAAYNANYSYFLSLNSTVVYPGTDYNNKYFGLTARCVLGP